MLSEEPERFLPRVVGRRLVEGGRVLVVEERVVDVRVDVDLGLLAGLLDGGVNGAGVVGLHELVLLGEEAEYGPAELAVIGLHVGMDAVEVDDRADLRIHGAGEERELAAHAEADGAHLLARGLRGQIIDGAPQVLLGLADVERHEELAGPVGLVGRLAVIHVGRQRGESLGGEAVADVLDVLHQPPPLLDHEHARALARRGSRQVARGLAAVRGKLRHLASHEGLLRSYTCREGAGAIFTAATCRGPASSTVIVYPGTWSSSPVRGIRPSVASTRPATVS